jgi:hypothetical protein
MTMWDRGCSVTALKGEMLARGIVKQDAINSRARLDEIIAGLKGHGCHFCFFGTSSPSEIQRKAMRGSAPMTWSFCPFEWQYSPALSTAAFTASVLCDMPPSDRLTPMV